MDPIQIVLIISLITVTLTLFGVGVWLILVLRELKTTVTKTNSILDDTKQITEGIAQPVSSFAEFFLGLKNGLAAFNTLFKAKKRK